MQRLQRTTSSLTTTSLGQRTNALPWPKPTSIIRTATPSTIPICAHSNPRLLFSKQPKMHAMLCLPTSSKCYKPARLLPNMSPIKHKHTCGTTTPATTHQCSRTTPVQTDITSAKQIGSLLDSPSFDLPTNMLVLPMAAPVSVNITLPYLSHTSLTLHLC